MVNGRDLEWSHNLLRLDLSEVHLDLDKLSA